MRLVLLLFALFWATPALADNATMKKRADEAYFHGEYGKAAELYVEYYDSLPEDDADILARISISSLMSGNHDGSYHILKLAVEMDPSISKEYPFVLRSDTMEPTLYENEKIICDIKYYEDFPVRRNDVVVAFTPNEDKSDLISRVHAIPGDTLQAVNGTLYINDKALPHTLPFNGNATVLLTKGKYTMKEGQYFVAPDKRGPLLDGPNSAMGYVPKEDIHCKVMTVYSSDIDPSRVGSVVR